MKQIILFFSVILLLNSCIKELEIQLPEPELQLVVNSLLNPDSIIKINITETTSVFDSVPKYISDAKVDIYENNLFKETLKYDKNGFYISDNNLLPEQGSIYTLKIQTNKFGLSQATDTVPYKNISVLNTTTDIIGTNTFGNYYAELTLNFEDPVTIQNFYEVYLFSQLVFTDQINGNDTVFTNIPWFSNELSVTESNENASDRAGTYHSILFNDNYFNGENVKLHINYFLPSSCVSENGHIIPENYKILIVFHTVSRQYFKFKQKLTLYESNENEFWNVGEAVYVKGNIKNGIGIFAGYTTIVDTLTWDY